MENGLSHQNALSPPSGLQVIYACFIREHSLKSNFVDLP